MQFYRWFQLKKTHGFIIFLFILGLASVNNLICFNKSLITRKIGDVQDIKSLKQSNSVIFNVKSPENRTYTKDSDYYLCSYDFEDYTINWGHVDQLDGHRDIIKMFYGFRGMNLKILTLYLFF